MLIKQNQRQSPQMKSPVKFPFRYKMKGPSALPIYPSGSIVVRTELASPTMAVTVKPLGPTDTN